MVSFPNVELANFPDVDEVDVKIIEKAFEKFFQKACFDCNEKKLHLTHKVQKGSGLRVQHEFNAVLTLGTKKFYASSQGWKLLDSLQDILHKLNKEVSKLEEKELEKRKGKY
jgi:ribosome-associated translation inhibitor RaiA